MVRLLLILVALAAFLPHAAAADQMPSDVDATVKKFNPDILALNPDSSPVVPMKNAFSTPASDIAADVASNNWFNLLVYLPFLIAPQVLLLVVIFRFRDRGDGRKPATFMTNHRLEMIWTVIPCLALVVVAVPVWKLLYKMELPPSHVDTNNPEQATIIKIIGKQFSWIYEYKAEGIEVGSDVAGNQEPMVIVKDRVVSLNITSNDVNHAWWVPAFGVKKDAIRGRYTNTWFTPTMTGVFKGNCAELCGSGHGIMFISAVVVEPEDFRLYRMLQRNRGDTGQTWSLLQPGSGQEVDQAKLRAAVAAYFSKDASEGRKFALRYWVAVNYDAMTRVHLDPKLAQDLQQHEAERRKSIDDLVASVTASAATAADQDAMAARK